MCNAFILRILVHDATLNLHYNSLYKILQAHPSKNLLHIIYICMKRYSFQIHKLQWQSGKACMFLKHYKVSYYLHNIRKCDYITCTRSCNSMLQAIAYVQVLYKDQMLGTQLTITHCATQWIKSKNTHTQTLFSIHVSIAHSLHHQLVLYLHSCTNIVPTWAVMHLFW